MKQHACHAPFGS